MLKVTLTTHKGEQILSIPQSWDEATIGQFQQIITEQEREGWLQDGFGWPTLFAILADNKELVKYFDNSDINGASAAALYRSICFVRETDFGTYFDNLPIPKTVTLKGVTLNVPNKLVMDTYRNLLLGGMINSKKDKRQCLSIAFSMYFQPLLNHGITDHPEAQLLEDLVLQMPVSVVYPIGALLINQATVIAG